MCPVRCVRTQDFPGKEVERPGVQQAYASDLYDLLRKQFVAGNVERAIGVSEGAVVVAYA
jgi:hypothetical protein